MTGETRSDRISLTNNVDSNVAAIVISVGEEYLTVCDALLAATRIDHNSDPERFALGLCLVYFLGKIQRTTRAALTLIIAGQGVEAMSLIREQHEFVIAFNYYRKHPDQAQLFMASQALLKRNFARKIMVFDADAAKEPKRKAQLEIVEKEAEDAYRLFPGLRRPKGRSGESGTPVMIDWSEPSAHDMFSDVMDGLAREHLIETEGRIDEAAFPDRLKKIVDRTYFFRNTFINQGKHGTAFDVGADVDLDDFGNVVLPSHQIEDPNGLAFHFIQNAMPPLLAFRDYNAPGELEEELSSLGSSYKGLHESLGIIDKPVAI